MPPSDDYSEKEMALILKRAAELQEGSDGPGVQRSLAQIQEIASEAGIEPAFVAEAAAELERPVPRIGWLGAPTRFHEERSVPAVLSPNDIGDLLDRARSELGLHGEVHQVFDGVEWRARSALGAAILTIGSRTGGTRIALTTERIDQAVAIASGSVAIGLLSALGGVAIAINVTNNAVVASAIVAASAIAGTVVSARALWHGVAERWRRKTRSVVEGLASRASQLTQTTLNNEKSLSRGA
ncbi:MAG TPA: hypothetical protein VGJ18_24625 [Gemmatimonadaceae bacterium]|jgi:hypothetical protein